MSEIRPAMTPEEWSSLSPDPMLRDSDVRVAMSWLADDAPPEKWIALANAALPDDDPRKITREHVELLRDAAEELHWSDEQAAGLNALAAALESLLPPR